MKLLIKWQNLVPSHISWYTAAGRAVVDVQVVQSLKQFSGLYPVPFRVFPRTYMSTFVEDLTVGLPADLFTQE